jgi:adenylosuccinate lyase
MENVALWGERDISHSSAERVILPDACLALDYILNLFTGVIRDLQVYPDQMKENIESTRGVLFSQRVLLALIEKGLARDEAYRIVHNLSMSSWENKEDLRGLLKIDPEVAVYLNKKELEKLFDYGYYVRYVDEVYERLGLS